MALGPEVGVFCDRLAPNFIPEHVHPWLQLMIALDGASCDATSRESGKSEVQTMIEADQVWIVPAGVPHSTRWLLEANIVVLYVAPGWAERVAGAVPTAASIETLRDYAIIDPFIGGFILEFVRECEARDPPNETHLLALGTGLAARLLRAKASGLERRREVRKILSDETLSRVTAFIDVCLAEEMSVLRLAKVAGISVNHFAMLFKATTGLTPEQYILHSRLWRARRLVETGKRTIGEIAHATGFADHSHLTMQFRRMFGAPPKAFLPLIRSV
ncbi:MAG: AraC family transcriptional regulator [Opitutaceae bacterium]